MYTQTEPLDPRDLEVKEFSTQTSTNEMATSTELDALETASVATSTATTLVGSMASGPFTLHPPPIPGRITTSKVATLVATLSANANNANTKPSVNTAATSTDTLVSPLTPVSPFTTSSSSSPLSPQEQEELTLLRAKNATLQAEIQSLKRDLASEMRARTRTAVAMQDTRDKFEMLSAIAYKKIKEMIFQRHVLEMEVRELRAQVDMHNAEDAAVSAAGTVVETNTAAYRQSHGRDVNGGHGLHYHNQQYHHKPEYITSY